MAIQVVAVAMLQCNFGNVPTPLVVLPAKNVMAFSLPAATVQDYIPLLNILPFGMCSSIMNPMVIAATAAAFGALTPMPCLPATAAPWTPGCKSVTIGGVAALNNSCTLKCLWGGQISIKMAGQFTVMIP